MQDYTATITFRVSIQAENEEQAESRASMIKDALASGGPKLDHLQKSKTWLGDFESETEVEED